MLSLTLVVVAAFIVGLFVTVRFKPGSVRVQLIGVSVGIAVVTAVIGYVSGLRGLELIATAVVWALFLPAAVFGNVVRQRMRPKTRL